MKQISRDSLGFRYPGIAADWNYERNGGVTPYDISSKNDEKWWWKCQEGHEWHSSIKEKRYCKICYQEHVKKLMSMNERKVKLRFSIATKYPRLAAEWHPFLNKIDIADVTHRSRLEVWWQCKNGHEWKASVISRSKKNSCCPFCKENNKKEEGSHKHISNVNASYFLTTNLTTNCILVFL